MRTESGSARAVAGLSIEERARLELRLRERIRAAAPPAIPRRAAPAAPAPLSLAQERLWLTHRLHPESPAYNVPLLLRLEGALHVKALEEALAEIVRRHEALRTTFPVIDGRPVQSVAAPAAAVLVREVAPDEVEPLVMSEARRPFDLARGPLVRLLLLRLGPQEHVLAFVAHHMVVDGWSLGVFARELAALYRAFAGGKPSPLPPLAIQYGDFAVWQRERLSKDALDGQLTYWKRHLGGDLPVLELPADRPRPASPSLRGGRHAFTLAPALSASVRDLCRREGATLFMVLLAGFQALLHRYTGETDIVTGTSVANRGQLEVEPLIGLFFNNLVLRTDLSGDPSFRELVARTRAVALGAYANQDVPFALLVETLRPARSGSHNPLFQVLFEVQNAAAPELEFDGLQVHGDSVGTGTAKADLVLDMWDGAAGLGGVFVYSAELFDHETVVRMAGHLETLLEAAVADPDQRLSALRLLRSEEARRVVHGWNHADVARPEATVLDRLAAQVARSPRAVALEGEHRRMTYAELDRRANQLAHRLQALGVGPEARVGLCVPRSPEMVVALLGILKAGAAYVPLDPTHPGERLLFTLDDAEARVVVAGASTSERLSGWTGQVVHVDVDAHEAGGPPTTHPDVAVHPSNLAYVIYTSGSTGRPKGVAVEHGSLVHYLDWASEAYAVDSGRGSVVQSSIAFDLTITSVFLPLLVGRTVTLLPEEDATAALTAALMDGPPLSLVKITPAHLELVNRRLPSGRAAGAPRALVVGGEALRAEVAARWVGQGTRVVNEYGPTETVVGCCVHEVEEGGAGGSVPIGLPIARTRLYVLDGHLRPVPLGARGELFIAGAGVARGYLGRGALTADRFLPDPFATRPGERMYRTGDVVRRRADGILEYFGRNDDQVKVRGFRVELAEVESALAARAGVAEAAVVVRDDGGERRLVGYYVGAEARPVPDPAELRRHLLGALPDYMIPSAFVRMASLPLTPNGKVDRRALPAPETLRTESPARVRPRDAAEAAMAALWEEVLGMSPVGVADGFFELGGHSLLAAELQWRIRERFGREVPLSVFFQEPTVEALTRWLGAAATPAFSNLVPLQERGTRPRLFLVHPLSGDIECFEDLARRMDHDQPVFALRDRHLSEIGGDDADLEELARRHVDALVALQPAGPYLLAGYSFGSILCFEMAQQIADRGLTVGLVALLDGTSPLVLQRAGDRGDVLPLAGMARDMARVAGVEVSLPYREMADLPREEAFERILEALKDAGLVRPDVGRPWLEGLLRGLRTRGGAIMRYRPRVYPGRLTLFRTTQVEEESARAWLEAGVDVRDRTRGWDALSAQPVVVNLIPGYHATLLAAPAVGVLAEGLRSAIDEALRLDHRS